MASNFAFKAAGLSQSFTVGGAAPVTVSMSLVPVGQSTTTSLSLGNYVPGTARIVNNGSASCFIQFSPTAAAATNVAVVGVQMLPNTVETFGTNSLPFFAAACGGTNTVTIGFTLGEGL